MSKSSWGLSRCMHSEKYQLDQHGFRPNVGMVVCNEKKELLYCRRYRHRSWQFPQGGIDRGEAPLDAMYRELEEEIGLKRDDVKELAQTKGWLHYRLPQRFLKSPARPYSQKGFVGQKQKWFLLQLVSHESCITLQSKLSDASPEFDAWKWVSYWHPLGEIVMFKRRVYTKMLHDFFPLLLNLSLS